MILNCSNQLERNARINHLATESTVEIITLENVQRINTKGKEVGGLKKMKETIKGKYPPFPKWKNQKIQPMANKIRSRGIHIFFELPRQPIKEVKISSFGIGV